MILVDDVVDFRRDEEGDPVGEEKDWRRCNAVNGEWR
jgi:hypothetical protein